MWLMCEPSRFKLENSRTGIGRLLRRKSPWRLYRSLQWQRMRCRVPTSGTACAPRSASCTEQYRARPAVQLHTPSVQGFALTSTCTRLPTCPPRPPHHHHLPQHHVPTTTSPPPRHHVPTTTSHHRSTTLTTLTTLTAPVPKPLPLNNAPQVCSASETPTE